MGGQNHQPTSTKLVAASAWLSKRVGDGFANVLKANSELEDALILAADKLYVEQLSRELVGTPIQYLKRSEQLLLSSVTDLADIERGYENLLDAARTEYYRGNPLAPMLPKMSLAEQFRGRLITPVENQAAWTSLEERIATDNILGTLEWEMREFRELRVPTEDLISVLCHCRTIAEEEGGAGLVEAIEGHHVPLRESYARVFSRWNYLHAVFLYSALIMTELFYRTNGIPSLTIDSASLGPIGFHKSA
jgi:hypothetical protein